MAWAIDTVAGVDIVRSTDSEVKKLKDKVTGLLYTGWGQLWLSLKAKTKGLDQKVHFNTGKSQVKTVWFSLALDLAEVDLTHWPSRLLGTDYY